MLYWEDFAEGAVLETESELVTADDIRDFATRFDPQPFHLSDEGARGTHFARMAASGWHTCAISSGLMTRKFMALEMAGLGSPGIDEIRWLKPVYAGDRLRAKAEILEVRASASRPGIGLIRNRLTTYNQHGDAVMTMLGTLFVRRRPNPA
ncbi:MAG: MaoC family dehydratase [Sphingomonadales bacterium]